MAIRAVFFDLDGTLLTPSGSPVAGVTEMIRELEEMDLRWAVGSNHSRAYLHNRLNTAGLAPDLEVSQESVGAKKPSPQFCYGAAKGLGIAKNEMVYVGDDNRTDAICAINASVLYLNAGWSNRQPNYGIKTATPKDVVRLVRTFLLRDPQWYWRLSATDPAGLPLDVRSIVPGGKDWDPILARPTFNVLKLDSDTDFPIVMKFSRFLFLYLLTTIYLDGLHDEVDSWCLIPPSGGNMHRKILSDYLNGSSKLFKAARYVETLLVRHTPSVKAAYARHAGLDPDFLNQANTMHLNPEQRKAVTGKHILVVDDYCTRGHSFECARHLLLRGGAAKVTCVSVGRYGTRYTVQVARDGLVWNPWAPSSLGEGDFQPRVYYEPSDASAILPIKDGFEYLINS
jgi:histidinol phosphatase-like enzyme